ncbi:hypothetical protein IWQ60_012067, partial [Tieghemiomyces parasiticus]
MPPGALHSAQDLSDDDPAIQSDEDYLNMDLTALEEQVASPNGSKRRRKAAPNAQQSQKRQAVSSPIPPLTPREVLQQGLATPLDATNRGYRMLARQNATSDMVQPADGIAPHVRLIPLVPKLDRTGLGFAQSILRQEETARVDQQRIATDYQARVRQAHQTRQLE